MFRSIFHKVINKFMAKLHQLYNHLFKDHEVTFHDGVSNQELIWGDSYKVIPKLPSNFDFIITDPEYNLHMYQQSKAKLARNKRDYDKTINDMKHGFSMKIIPELVNLQPNNKINIGMFISQQMISPITDYFRKHYGCTSDNFELVAWIKSNGSRHHGNHLQRNVEYYLYIHKNVKLNSGSNAYHVSTSGYLTPRNEGEDKLFRHQTVKSLFMVRNFIMDATHIGDNVLDCFGGTGTTSVACKMIYRNCTCIDKNLNCVETAVKRMLPSVSDDEVLIDDEIHSLENMQSCATYVMKADRDIKNNIRYDCQDQAEDYLKRANKLKQLAKFTKRTRHHFKE